MEKDIGEIKVHIVEIKADLKYHIKRTDELEEMLLPIYKFKIWAQYTIIIASAIAAILALKDLLL